ncbi:MAG: two-component sensor histidine kinase [Paenibacillus sp.]|uniref:sensor histidine kinase n=1 Tax=Paenibacillus sp. GCM10012303 TaxID=3317340 RepID=UPI0029F39EC2|nr:two-component sensor histidine kinase [Paenibacillus sp.]
MSVNRKMFWAMASFILALSLVYFLITQLVVKESMGAMADMAKGEQVDSLSRELVAYYETNGRSWEGARQYEPEFKTGEGEPAYSYLLLSADRTVAAHKGEASEKLIRNLGLKRELRSGGEPAGYLVYYDPEIAVYSKLRIGIPSSVSFLLAASVFLFLPFALLVAYWVSRRITAPLRQLIPAIDRVGAGNFGDQVQIASRDEYGKVASAFNSMSMQLKRTEELRRCLVADVAHELRTPLTILQGKLDYLQQGGGLIDPERLLPLQDELIRLTRLVGDLHELSQAEAGKLSYEFKETDMRDVLERTVDRLLPGAEEKGIEIRFVNKAVRTRLTADPNRISQVFLNLLVNAIHYTPSGGSVDVLLQEQRNQADEPVLTVEVRDNGPGIGPEHLPHLFDRFYRTDEARSRNSGGTGLGLAIAKEFVLAHRGEIRAQSSLGAGSAFIVTLPFDFGKIPPL